MKCRFKSRVHYAVTEKYTAGRKFQYLETLVHYTYFNFNLDNFYLKCISDSLRSSTDTLYLDKNHPFSTRRRGWITLPMLKLVSPGPDPPIQVKN